ncbi:TonB-dependent receptor plug domain-containing protein [Pseudoduganella umbonata]|uniref:Iron complex outermembrane receptor protein n=1 Tax=Pseudoduganella umbonata TaxID=864828 RepID=A0A4P8HSV0_9BURK|nr:TonB-dependent receptor [Pseudoduganella umbonata]MBB3225027.1 iron complex outermembrane receptor protein [Pseudoduganella umbonata]QCP11495.1 TonB-dependent receptor [Pseudoduganella umbonata]
MSTRLRTSPLALSIIAAAVAATIAPASAQQQAPAEELQTVVVTGTYAKNRRTADSESPIDIIGAKELQATGSTELATVLSRLLPSMNFPRPSGADASDAVRPAQLRGLAPDQTLVLVNGKRRHASAVVNVNGTAGRGSAPVDLNAIPLAAIDHIEVLRDGASAQYGSDAIAGVVNIILKKGPNGGDVEIGTGWYGEGDGEQVSLKASAGFALGDKGWLRLAAEGADRNPTNRAGADTRNPAEPLYGQVTQRYGDSDTKPRNVFFNAQYQLGENTDAYAFGQYGERDTEAAATWRTALNGGVQRTPLFPQGFLPLQNSTSTDASLVAGVRGDLGEWRWDASLDWGRNRFSLDIDNTVNQDLGASSPTRFHLGRLTNTQSVANFDLAREIPVAAFSGPLTVATGLEIRHEEYEINDGDPASYTGSGSQGFSGFRPVNAGKNSRSNQSAYVNLEAQVTPKLSGVLAARYEHYTDFGSTTSAKASARYAFNDQVSVRGTASTGFRAPSLAQQFYTITTTNFAVVNGINTPIETGTFAVGSSAAQALGATPLKAEKARNYGIGVQWAPTRNFNTTVDVYRIFVDDRIALSANMTLPQTLRNTLANQGVQVGAGRYFTNAIDTKTTGVDVVGTYRWNLANRDRVDFTAAYNRNKTQVENVAANPAILTANNLLLIDRQTVQRNTVGSPKDKLSLGADYTAQAWSARALATQYGKFTVPQNNPANDQTYGHQWVLDVSGTVRLATNWRVTAGIDNLTDSYPDKTTSVANLNTNGIYPYSNFSPAGFNGRFFYAKVGYSW